MASIEVKVPDIGDFDAVEIIEVLVAEGDRVETEASLITLESDKATMDVPAPEAGVVKSLRVKAGDKVSEGDLILELELEAADAGAPADEQAEPEASPETTTPEEAPAAPPAPAAASSSEIEVDVPDIGDFESVEIIEVLVAEGDMVDAEASLITLESDKATMDVPAPVAGKVKSLKVKGLPPMQPQERNNLLESVSQRSHVPTGGSSTYREAHEPWRQPIERPSSN